jgi:hypothetical protein
MTDKQTIFKIKKFLIFKNMKTQITNLSHTSDKKILSSYRRKIFCQKSDRMIKSETKTFFHKTCFFLEKFIEKKYIFNVVDKKIK